MLLSYAESRKYLRQYVVGQGLPCNFADRRKSAVQLQQHYLFRFTSPHRGKGALQVLDSHSQGRFLARVGDNYVIHFRRTLTSQVPEDRVYQAVESFAGQRRYGNQPLTQPAPGNRLCRASLPCCRQVPASPWELEPATEYRRR